MNELSHIQGFHSCKMQFMMTCMKAHLCKLHDRFDAGFCGINIVSLGSLGKMDCFAYIEEDTNFLHLLLSFFTGYSAY